MTQQVGAENDRELVDLLLPGTKLAFPEQYLEKAVRSFTEPDLKFCSPGKRSPKSAFYDVGALVWFARIIEWEFPDSP